MTDRFVVRVVVLGLLALGVLALAGITACALTGHSVPDVLQNIAVGALTALGAVLAKTSTEPQPVVVQNEPVAVTERARRKDAGHSDLIAALVVVLILVIILAAVGLI